METIPGGCIIRVAAPQLTPRHCSLFIEGRCLFLRVQLKDVGRELTGNSSLPRIHILARHYVLHPNADANNIKYHLTGEELVIYIPNCSGEVDVLGFF